MDGGIGKLPRWGAGGWGNLTCAFDTTGQASPLEISSSLCTQDPALSMCVRLWLWFLPSPQICSWFMAGKSHASTQLLFNKGQISLSAVLPFPLPSLSLLSLQLKSNRTQRFLVPQHVSTPSILMTCNMIVFLSTQPQHLFLLSSSFLVLAFWASTLILSAWQQETDWSQPFLS